MMYNAAQLTYLEHLGIDVWVPKDVPVQALEEASVVSEPSVQQAVNPFESTNEFNAPTHFEDVPVQPVNQPASNTQPQVSHSAQAQPQVAQQPAPQTPQIQAPNNQTPAPVANVQSALTSPLAAPAFPQSAKPNTQNQNEQATPSVAFHVQFWCYSSGVWFISGDVNVTPEQHKLVHNLAQFIQRKKRKPRHVNVFSWPMIDSPNVDQGADVANKYLLSHIERLQDACQQKQVFVFNDCQYYPENLPHVKLNTTLQQLLSEPQAKRVLWQQLLPYQLPE